MKNLPREIVNIIIMYFRGYENMEKKKLELGPKDEQVCDIIVAKYCSIVEEEDKLREKIFFEKMSQYKFLLKKLLEGEITENQIKISPVFDFRYLPEYENPGDDIYYKIKKIRDTVDDIFYEIERLYKTIYKHNGIIEYSENLIDLLVSMFKNIMTTFIKITNIKSTLHYYLCQKKIYIKLIDVYWKINNIILNSDKYIQTNTVKKYKKYFIILQNYKNIHLNIISRYFKFETEKNTLSNIYCRLSLLYKNTKEKYNFGINKHICILRKMYLYYRNTDMNFLYLISDIIDDVNNLYKYLCDDSDFEDNQDDIDIDIDSGNIYNYNNKYGNDKIYIYEDNFIKQNIWRNKDKKFSQYESLQEINDIPNFCIFEKGISLYNNDVHKLRCIFEEYDEDYEEFMDNCLIDYLKTCRYHISDYENNEEKMISGEFNISDYNGYYISNYKDKPQYEREYESGVESKNVSKKDRDKQVQQTKRLDCDIELCGPNDLDVLLI